MSYPSEIVDGHGTGYSLKINEEGTANVVVHPHPPLSDPTVTEPFRQFFTDDGAPTGSEDMTVNGSTTEQEFFITAQAEKDVYIKSISVVISDAGAALNEFGNLAALTNGCKFTHFTSDGGETVINDSLTTNFEFVRLAIGNPSFGNGANSFRANNVSGTSEAFLPVIDMQAIFGMPLGLKLRKGTLDRVIFTIRDNVSALDQFDAIGYGVRI